MIRKAEYLMHHRAISKLIVSRTSLTLLDGKAVSISRKKNPLVALLKADTAVTFCD
jgi:hypothetical protein